jgi:hypothetical protein
MCIYIPFISPHFFSKKYVHPPRRHHHGDKNDNHRRSLCWGHLGDELNPEALGPGVELVLAVAVVLTVAVVFTIAAGPASASGLAASTASATFFAIVLNPYILVY